MQIKFDHFFDLLNYEILQWEEEYGWKIFKRIDSIITIFFFSLAVLLLVVSIASAQWAVIDAGNIKQTTIIAFEQVKQTYKQAQGYLKQLEQLQNEYNMIKNQKDQISNQYAQITNQVQNLQRLPGSIQQALMANGNKLTALFGAVNQLSYASAGIASQFDQLYNLNEQSKNSQEALQKRLLWLQGRKATAALAVQSTALAEDMAKQFETQRILLSRSYTVQGNLDAQQIAHQQAALAANIALQSQQMDAIKNRLLAQEQAELAVLEQARLKMAQEAMQPLDVSLTYIPEGKIQDYTFWYPTR